MLVSDLKENPKNPKILNEKGRQRLHLSLSKFGLAGTIICNVDLTIIDGHSRKKDLIDKGVKEVWVSVPSRKLTQKEYDEMNAMFDVAKAGDPDMMMIEEVIGEEVLEEWGFEKKERPDIELVELKPFRQTHVLLSFPPERMIDLQDILQQLSDLDYVEYAQSSN